MACYRLFAFPSHWRSEIPCQDAHALSCHDELCHMTQVFPLVPDDMMPKWEDKKARLEPGQIATHIGGKSGLSMYNLGWTSHLPSEYGLLCAKHDLHRVVPEEGSSAWSLKPVTPEEVTTKANPSVESTSVLATPYASLKRKMQEDLYDPISKKMRPESEVGLEMGAFSTEVAGRHMSVVHNEVFRMVGRAGLINLADFDVGSDGVVGLSKHALKKVYPHIES
ncbi:hypothetical protein F52700_6882 [Fusarium sp. NRRL 52700]|nr:hypothetical protein F52700_6882 [Fusarium sp. NRRL 52700]